MYDIGADITGNVLTVLDMVENYIFFINWKGEVSYRFKTYIFFLP